MATNLTGLLSEIGGTIGEMGAPGNAFVDNFRQLNAPNLDQNDPASLRAYADWAQRNGDMEAAQRYQLAAGKLEQEQAASKAAVDSKGFGRSISKLEEARRAAIKNAGGDQQAIGKINSQYDTAVQAVSSKMNDMAAKYGLDTTGDDMVTSATQKADVVDALESELAMADEDDAPAIRRAIAGVKSGVLSPAEGLEAIENTKQSTSSYWGDAERLADDYNTRNGLKPGDEGYKTPGMFYETSVGTVTDTARAAELQESKTTAQLRATQRAEDINDASEAIIMSQENMALYEEAIALIDAGAETGRIENMFASLTGETLALENVRSKLGLSIVGAGKFGQLTEKELELALQTGLPTNMQEDELKQWIQDKMAAEAKLMNRYRAYLEYSKRTGGTMADFQGPA